MKRYENISFQQKYSIKIITDFFQKFPEEKQGRKNFKNKEIQNVKLLIYEKIIKKGDEDRGKWNAIQRLIDPNFKAEGGQRKGRKKGGRSFDRRGRRGKKRFDRRDDNKERKFEKKKGFKFKDKKSFKKKGKFSKRRRDFRN